MLRAVRGWSLVLCIVLGGVALLPPLAGADLSGRVLELTLNEGTGTSLTDTGSGGHTATATDPTWVSGASCTEGACIEFNGSTATVTVTDADDLSMTTGAADRAHSMTLWMYLDAVDVHHDLVAKGTFPYEFDCYVYTDAKLHCLLWESDASANIGRSAPLVGASHADQWVHVAITYSGSETSAGIKIYLNGTQADTADEESGSYTGQTNSTSALTVFSTHGGASAWTVGERLDRLRVYSRELSGTDVLEDMVLTAPRNRVFLTE